MERLKDALTNLNIDFVRWRYVAGIASVITVFLCWGLFFLPFIAPGLKIGPNWGIDFTGGTEILIHFDDDVQIGEVREALTKLGLAEDSVQAIGAADRHEYKIRIQDAEFGNEQAKKDVNDRLVKTFGPDWILDSKFDAEVGARVVITHAPPIVKPAEVQAAFSDMQGVAVRSGRDDNQVVIQLPGLSHQIEEQLQVALGDAKFHVLSVDAVGPKVGADLRTQAGIAMFMTIFLVVIYIAFRFELAFAPGAMLALVHDVSIMIGFFILFHREFSLSLIGAILTVIGYSLNDTIIIYDRIRENRSRYRRKPTIELINLSVNETLTRTISTSFNTMLAISPFLVMGGSVVQDFAFAMFLGIVFGTYSTIYVASPMILLMEEVQPYLERWIAVTGRGKAAGAAITAAAAVGAPPVDAPSESPVNRSASAIPTAVGPAAPAVKATPTSSVDAPAERPMTESEKRRRERAEREKAAEKGNS